MIFFHGVLVIGCVLASTAEVNADLVSFRFGGTVDTNTDGLTFNGQNLTNTDFEFEVTYDTTSFDSDPDADRGQYFDSVTNGAFTLSTQPIPYAGTSVTIGSEVKVEDGRNSGQDRLVLQTNFPGKRCLAGCYRQVADLDQAGTC